MQVTNSGIPSSEAQLFLTNDDMGVVLQPNAVFSFEGLEEI